jgi:hypothetical protein
MFDVLDVVNKSKINFHDFKRRCTLSGKEGEKVENSATPRRVISLIFDL